MRNYKTTPVNNTVSVYQQDENGSKEFIFSLPANEIPSRLDAGEWDTDSYIALLLLTELTRSTVTLTDIRVARWLVAHCWITEQAERNGSPVFDADNLPIAFPLYKTTTRLALANNVEGALVERFGYEQGLANALCFYQRMLDAEQGALALSAFGRDVLTAMHRSFIEDILAGSLNVVEVRH